MNELKVWGDIKKIDIEASSYEFLYFRVEKAPQMKKINCIALLLALMSIGKTSLSQSTNFQVLLDSSIAVKHLKNQSDSLASLAYQLALETKDVDKQIQALTAKAKTADYHYDRDGAYAYYEKILDLAKQGKNTKLVGDTYLVMGWIKHGLGEHESAISLIDESITMSAQVKDTFTLSEGYNYLGTIYSNIGNHDLSIENFLKSLELAELSNNSGQIANSSQGIGVIYNKQEDFDKAEKYFSKAMDEYVRLKDTSRMVYVINDFGILNKNRGNYTESEKWYLKMLEIAKERKYAWVKPYAYNNLGTLYFLMENYEEGENYSQKGADYGRSGGIKIMESDALNSLAKNQLAQNKNKDAINNLKRSLTLSREIQAIEKERESLLILSNAYEKIDQPKLALQYFKEHKIIYDSIYDSAKSKQIHDLESKYQTAKKDNEIILLAKNAELEKVKNTRLWIGLILTLLLSSLLIWFQKQKRKREKLVEAEKQKVKELENQKLSQELDFKKQELASKVLQLCRKNEFLVSLDKRVKNLKTVITGEGKTEVEKLSRQILKDMEVDNDWAQFLKSFESVHPTFNSAVTEKYPTFSKGELRMACLLKMNLSTKDIANLLNITIAGVKKSRNRMRKKMDIDSSVDLTNHFMVI